MEAYQEKLIECCEAYRSTGSAQMLITYRSRTDRLSFDERMTVIRECQEAFAPFSLEMCKLVPGLGESDLLFCALSAMGFSNVIIAECLTITPDAVRMRKLRFREKVSPEVYATLFPTPEKHSSTGAKRNKSERDDKVTENNCTASDGTIPLQHVSINPLTSKSMKTKMTFGKAIKSCYKQYFTTKGRASRAEFIYFQIFTLLASPALVYFAAIFGLVVTPLTPAPLTPYLLIGSLFLSALLFGIPQITVAARRFHDIERSGAWIWLYFSPLLVLIAYLIVFVYQLIIIQNEEFVSMPHSFGPAYLYLVIVGLNFIISIVIFIWLCQEGTEGPNRYGPDPTVVTSGEQSAPAPAETV